MATVEQRAFSAEEVATMLGVSRRTVYRLMDEGKLGSRKLRPRTRRVFFSHLSELVGEQEAQSLVQDFNRK